MFKQVNLIGVLMLAVVLPTEAYERATGSAKLLNATPEKVIRLETKSRMPASVDARLAKKKQVIADMDAKLKIGSYAIIQNTVDDWNDEVVQIVSRFENGRRKVQRPNGKFLYVEPDNLHTLSPETQACCDSKGTQICNGDTVYHPLVSSSIGLPEGKVLRTFENCAMVVRDGLGYIYEANQLGKPATCSPQKQNICVGKTVFVQGYRNGNRYTFEGPVTQVYTDGTILVGNGATLMPVDATTAQVQTESIAEAPKEGDRGPASVGGSKEMQTEYPSLEPFDASDLPEEQQYRGLSIPAHK